MKHILAVSQTIDRFLHFVARIGGWLGAFLILVVSYDVVTRYFGVPKFWGLTSTKIQEFEYWLHSYLIVLVVGYAYVRQSHVRIDLLRETLPKKTKYWIEAIGILIALLPYSLLGLWLSWPYTVQSYLSGEISKSQTGLSNIWMLKGGLVVLFILLGLAGVSQFLKAVAGIRGELPEDMEHQTVGGDSK